MSQYAMSKAKIGIRYCGGCNPHYDRVEAIERVRSLVEDRFLFLRHDGGDPDGLIAVSGCLRACAVKDLKEQEIPCHSITGCGDFDHLMQWLLAFKQEGINQ